MTDLGFKESYRRKHPGQGTENVCYCFDNMYIALIWVTTQNDLISPVVEPLKFNERSKWTTLGTSPFGIALRCQTSFPFESHLYHAPYLPEGVTLPYAKRKDTYIFSLPSFTLTAL